MYTLPRHSLHISLLRHPMAKQKKTDDGDGYFGEELKVDIGTFSLDGLDMSDDSSSTEDKSKKKKQ